MTLKLFRSGGPGSGFKGHRGRPGEVGGSSRSGIYDTELSYEQVMSIRRPKNRVENIVRKIGFPVEKVHAIDEQGFAFEVNGEMYRAGAQYDPRTGEITIWDTDSKSDQQLEGILAHEIQHSRWDTYKNEYQRQFIEVQKSVRDSDNKEDWLIRGDGSLRNPKDNKKYWAYDIHESFLTQRQRWERLRKTDGISAYSKSYWKQAEKSGSAWDYDRAIDETLAEIARIKTGHARPGDKKAIRPIWASLYNRVQTGTGMKKNSLFLFSIISNKEEDYYA